MDWVLHANGTAIELASPKSKRSTNRKQVDTYDGYGLTPSSLPLEKAINGGLLYDDPFRYVTQGGTAGGLVYTGVKPQSDLNVAVLAFHAAGTFRSSEKCAKVHEIYFGCTTTNVERLANVPLGCTLMVEALRPGSNRQDDIVVDSQEFTFTPVIKSNVLPPPIAPVYSDMAQAVINVPRAAKYRVRATVVQDFGALLSLLPKVIRDLVAPLLQSTDQLTSALLLDNVAYTIYDTDELCAFF